MKKTLKKLFATSLAVMLATTGVVSAVAEEGAPVLLSPKYLKGEIVNEGDNFIEVYSQFADQSVIVNILDDTFIVEEQSGVPMDLGDRKSDQVIVYYGPVETRSMPPRSNGVVVICNVTDGIMTANYMMAEEVEKSDDKVRVTGQDGSIIVTVNKDTAPSLFFSGEKVTVKDIEVGDKLLLWYGMVALSYPGQATATKAVILEKADAQASPDGFPGEQPGGEPEAGNEEAPSSQTALNEDLFAEYEYDRNGVRMVPLRLVAEACGYSVEWDAQSKAVTISDGQDSYRIVIGEVQCGDIILEAAPEIKDSLSYVPLSFFEGLLLID